MDEVVQKMLQEWDLGAYIDNFKEQKVSMKNILLLEEKEIRKLIPHAGPRAAFLKSLNALKDLPSTSTPGKRKSASLGKLSTESSPAKRVAPPREDEDYNEIKMEVKEQMDKVEKKMNSIKSDFVQFLRKIIEQLKQEKKEMVGVFGRSGAGKSSLINAIIGEKNLLPTGHSRACTSAVIKLVMNTKSEYEAQIDFITKEEWKEEWWAYRELGRSQTNQNEARDGDEDGIGDKLSAVYGDGWKDFDDLLDDKHFKEIPEFLLSEPKIIRHKEAEKLAAEYGKFIKTQTDQEENKGIKKWYWPLVKRVTLKLPGASLLQNVTLVDLPGTGDRNKSRNKMWKEMVTRCSTVWIVTDVTRAASEPEAWEILENASSLMGNGGECQQIHFICNKADQIDDPDIINEMKTIKEEVKKEFRKDEEINKHFSESCLEVFTVSAKDSLAKQRLNPQVNEIWELRNILQTLNDHPSKTRRYASVAHAILYFIDGAKALGQTNRKNEIKEEIQKIIFNECNNIKKTMEEAIRAFEVCLNDGVEKSQNFCEGILKSVIYPTNSGSSFHKTLKSVVEKGGVHKPTKGKLIDLNKTLSSLLTQSIDERFKKTFPNERQRGAFDNAINNFSLDTVRLTKDYKAFKLHLVFLKAEADSIKTFVNAQIRDQKKEIYHRLTETIENNMKDAYKRAATIKGKDSLKNLRETLETHVRDSKFWMFQEANYTMVSMLNDLKDKSIACIEDTLKKSVNFTFSTDDTSLPDVSAELKVVKNLYDQLHDH